MPKASGSNSSSLNTGKGGSNTPEGSIRKSQRAPTRCQRCAKRRVKCDGKIPCSSCIERGIAYQCYREPVLVKGRLVSHETTASASSSSNTIPGFGLGLEGNNNIGDIEILEKMSKEEIWEHMKSMSCELVILRTKIKQLEQENQSHGIGLGASRANMKSRSSMSTSNSPNIPTTTTTQSQPTDELTIMARKLGFIYDNHDTNYNAFLEMDGFDPNMTFPVDLKPIPYTLNNHLLDFAFEELGWLICPIPKSFKDRIILSLPLPSGPSSPSGLPTSENEGNSGINIIELINLRPFTSSLHLSILSTSLIYLPLSTAQNLGLGITNSEDKFNLAKKWFRTALNILLSNGGNCLQKPNLIHLQIFCVLTLVFQPFDCMALHDTLLAAMIQGARRLGLHLLRDKPEDRTPAGEIGRRIWTFLLSREIHYTGEDYCASVSRYEPEPFATFLNISEPDLPISTFPFSPSGSGPGGMIEELPLSQPTRVSYLMAQSRVTAFTRYLKNNLSFDETPYEEILRLDEKLKFLLNDMEWISSTIMDMGLEGKGKGYPGWVSTARHVIALKVSQRRLYLHRQYFSLTATNPLYAPSRHLSIEAALEIFHERLKNDLPFDDKLDTINGILPASIVLLLDCIYPLPNQKTNFEKVLERCRQVDYLLKPFRHSPLTTTQNMDRISGMTATTTTNQLNKTLTEIDNLLNKTLNAAQTAELVRHSWELPNTSTNTTATADISNVLSPTSTLISNPLSMSSNANIITTDMDRNQIQAQYVADNDQLQFGLTLDGEGSANGNEPTFNATLDILSFDSLFDTWEID